MNRTVEILLLFIILAIAGVTSYVLLKVGLNSYSGKVVAISLVVLTLVAHIVFLEEKTREDKIFLYILTILSVIFLIKYIPAIFSIPISVFLILMAFYSVHLQHRLPRFVFIVPLALAMLYMFSFITKPIIVTSTTGYAVVRQTIFPATITSISGNTITFSQVAKETIYSSSGKTTLFPMTMDCAYNTNNNLTYCFELTGKVNYNNVIGYYIKGRIGNVTCFILLFSNNTYKTNCPYIKKVTYNKIEFYGTLGSNYKVSKLVLNYSITFNISGFKRLIDYVFRPLSCRMINASCKEMDGMHIYFNTKGTPYVVGRYEIIIGGRKIYSETEKYPKWIIDRKINVKVLLPATKSPRFICANVWLYRPKNGKLFEPVKQLKLCSPIPFGCLNLKYLEYVSQEIHHYYTPYTVQAQINITKVELPYVYIGIKFNKTDFGKKVGLVIYNNKKSSPTLETRLVGNCNGNTCYEIVKEPLPAVNKTNNIKVELIAGPNSKVVSKTEKMYNPIKKVMQSKNMTKQEKSKMINQTMNKIKQMQQSYKPMYKNVAQPMSTEMQNVDTVSKGYKIILGVSLAFMVMLIFML